MPENFKGYKIYGPYLSKKENRQVAVLVSSKHRTSMSWARYLVCKKEDRWLNKNEHVDHINGDTLDDRLENLQIMSQTDNNRKSHPGRKVEQHGTLSMHRYCKPPCNACSSAKRLYMRNYMRERRKNKNT